MAQPDKQSRSYHHGNLRDALIRAALDQIGEGDVASVSLRAVARRVGVTTAAPYHHFANKSALLGAVAAEGFRELNRRIGGALAENPGDPAAAFFAMGMAYIEFAITHRAHYRVMFRPELTDPDEHPELHEEGTRAFSFLTDLVEGLVAAEKSSADPMVLAVTAWSGVHGFATLWNEGSLRIKCGVEDWRAMAAPVCQNVAEQILLALRKG